MVPTLPHLIYSVYYPHCALRYRYAVVNVILYTPFYVCDLPLG